MLNHSPVLDDPLTGITGFDVNPSSFLRPQKAAEAAKNATIYLVLFDITVTFLF